MNGEAFDEYDEAEASDEAFEASDEADEAFEASDEADEAFEASDEADEADEAFEASDEADEADEAASVSTLNARIRLAKDQQRRREWKARVASSLRADVKRANATQQDIARQIRAINVGGPARSQSISPIQGDGVVTATLANGRSARMSFRPKLAPLGEVNRLRQQLAFNDKQQATALATQRRAIANLAMAQAAAVKKLTDQQVKSDKDLGERIVQSYNKLDKRISSELNGSKGVVEKNNKRIIKWMKQQRRRQLLNNVLITSALPLYAAYGDRSDPFSRDNLILTASLGGWLLADEFIGGMSNGKRSKALNTAANAWSWLAPVGNFATVQFLLKDRQHERFVTSVNTFNGPATTADASIPIAKDSVADFAGTAGQVPVVATVVTGRPDTQVRARVNAAAAPTPTVTLEFEPALLAGESVTVAWMVDTQPAA
jgi:hypothetical protein